MSDDLLQRVVPPPEPAGPGFRLRAAREARGLSYQDVEAATRIRARYLEALETGKYDVMPGGEAQVRGFLRRYATFLNIPPKRLSPSTNGRPIGQRLPSPPRLPRFAPLPPDRPRPLRLARQPGNPSPDVGRARYICWACWR
jgi:cytoskeleton protein RodZ